MPLITYTSVVGPTYNPHGEYAHWIAWQTAGRDGFIVQLIYRESQWQDAAGHHQSTSKRYWEAWRVDSNGLIFPTKQLSQGKVNDYFGHTGKGPDTKGDWEITGLVYWLIADGFVDSEWTKTASPSGSGAGILYCRESNPNADILDTPILSRREGGVWNSTATGTHAHKDRY